MPLQEPEVQIHRLLSFPGVLHVGTTPYDDWHQRLPGADWLPSERERNRVRRSMILLKVEVFSGVIDDSGPAVTAQIHGARPIFIDHFSSIHDKLRVR